jgi:hypothetical protein
MARICQGGGTAAVAQQERAADTSRLKYRQRFD